MSASGAAAPRARLPVHVLALAAVVALAWLATGSAGMVTADEGAMLAQLDQLERTGSWSAPNPEPVVDPGLATPPLELSDRTAEGRWAPFAKHPAHIALLRLPWAVAGHDGVVAVSLGCVVLAAWAAARIARRVRPGTEVAVLWAAGVGSPLLFYGFQVVGHAMAAATFGLAVLAALRALDRGTDRSRALAWGAVAAALVALTALVRSEGVLAGLALGAALGWVGLRGGRRRAVVVGAAAGAAGLAVLIIEPLLVEAVVGGPLLEATSQIESEGLLADRWAGFRVTVIDAGYGVEDGEVFLALSTVAVVGAALAWRLRRDARLASALAVVAAALGVVRLATTDFLVPGLLQATPALTAALALVTAERVRAWPARVLVPAGGAFLAAVVATQYRTGGSGEWGGRYFALGLPLLVALAVPLLADAGEALPAARRRLLAGCLAVASLALAAGAVSATADARRASAAVAEAVVAAVEDADVDATVSTNGAISRFAWDDVVGERRWLTSGREDLPGLTARLAGDGAEVERLGLVTRELDDDLAAVDPAWRVEEEREVRRGTFVVVLARVGD